MSQLEEYYNDHVKNIYDPEFADLPEEHKEALKKTTHYAMWMVNYHMKDAVKAMARAIKII